MIVFIRIIYLNIYKGKYYKDKLYSRVKTYTYGLSSPRGRILDINGNVLVDNKKKRVIVYHKNKNIKKETEYYIASVLSTYLDENTYVSDKEKGLYIIDKVNIFDYVDKNTYDEYFKQMINYKDVQSKALDNILENHINLLSKKESLEAKIYYLMNKDYFYDKKIIFNDISEKEYFEILKLNLPGITGEYIYERYYPYESVMRGLFGSVGKISLGTEKEYLSGGYLLSDDVGTSFLEKKYESLLRGKKAKFLLNDDGTLTEVKKESPGEDLVLNIDLNILLKADDILRRNLINAQGKKNAQYFKEAYLIISKPDGSIISALGYKLDEKNNLIDVSSNIINSSFVLGSVVKAASNTVAYHENVIDRGKKVKDSCVKLYLNKEKCSYKYLGYVDDISSLEKSSNYYQFINAIKVLGYDKYTYNMKIDKDVNLAFNKYRTIFNKYGLGSKTYIDLDGESVGIKGSIAAPDLLLNFSIGQYDSYTPAQLISYINTVSNNGVRYNLSLSSKIDKYIVDKIDISSSDLKRINEGLHSVITKGTASNYIYKKDGAGKTGTSETLYDKDSDGIYETKTISTAFVGYLPYDNPKYTIALITPNISSDIRSGAYRVPINRYIISELSEFLFEN